MKHKEKLFKLLRECAETPQESFAVEEMIRKVEGNMPPIEIIDDKQKKFAGMKFYKNVGKNFCCTMSIHRFIWQYFNGEIPEGFDVHHRDFNHDNNDIANLELVTKDEHKKIHAEIKSKRKPDKKSKFTCAVCGREYEAANRGNNTYCSAKCKKIAERTRAVEIKTCEVCGKIFSDVVSKHRKHCSPECAAAALKRREIRACLHCGKEFSAQINRTQKFCSRECFYKHRRETRRTRP